jgi:hypothetical protein
MVLSSLDKDGVTVEKSMEGRHLTRAEPKLNPT